jgi:hypothetical protein
VGYKEAVTKNSKAKKTTNPKWAQTQNSETALL